MERHLHQHIAKLFLHQHRVIGIDGLQRLTGLLQKILPDGGMGLHLVPRAAVLRVPQDAQDLQQLFCRVGGLGLPVQHSAHTPCKRYCILYRIFRVFSRQHRQIPAICLYFLHFSLSRKKQDGALRGAPPCCLTEITAVRRTCCRTVHRPKRAHRTAGSSCALQAQLRRQELPALPRAPPRAPHSPPLRLLPGSAMPSGG